MTLRQFIRENHTAICDYICTVIGENLRYTLDVDECELWVMNDEGLYSWAQQEDVDI